MCIIPSDPLVIFPIPKIWMFSPCLFTLNPPLLSSPRILLSPLSPSSVTHDVTIALRPLSKTVRFNVLSVERQAKSAGNGKQFGKF